MSYKVILSFADIEDHGYLYSVGDCFPRKGAIPNEDRIAFLASNRNLIGQPVIQKVEDEPEIEEIKKDPIEAKVKRRGRPKNDHSH